MRLDFSDSMAAIVGSGGGGGKGGGDNKQAESPNTLRSNARIRLVELVSEGPIVGLVDGAKSIYFDNTPLQNPDGTFNFGGEINGGDQGSSLGSGIKWEQRLGLPDQPHLYGTPMAETPVSVEVRVRASAPPLVRTITEPNADAVRCIIRIPALARQNRENGNLEPTSVAYAIDVRSSGGEWQTPVVQSIENQKCTSPYLRQHRIELPLGGYPWEIRVRRMTPDSELVELQNETWWESYTVVTEGKFIYPDSALISLEINAREFGQSVPSQTFDVKGLIIKVPTNYNSETREYSGVWDGSFKNAWTDNPAWVFYDLLTNPRYGLGEFVEEYRIDKWGLYIIAQYCDQLVPSGYKSSLTGLDIMEPRFTFNGVINSRDEAYKVLQDITSSFRGMAYWSLGQVIAVADMPVDPVKIVAPANVLGGHFKYSGSAMKARHSVALVKWNDPQDFYRPGVELVQSDEMLQRFGWRQTEIQAKGCTSRGQAHRYGKWLLDTEQHETEMVEYTCSWEQADLLPGQIILVSDPRKAQVRTGGRLKAATATQFDLDRSFLPVAGNDYYLVATLPDGSIFSGRIGEFVPASMQPDGSFSQVRTLLPMPQVPLKGAMWVISGTDVEPMRFRVLSVREESKNTFKITGLFHDPTKYARVEDGIYFDPPPYTRPRTQIRPPVNLRAVESLFYESGVAKSRISLSWTPSDDFLAVGYIVSAQTPDGFQSYGQFAGSSCDISGARAGRYSFYVSAVSISGVTSQPAMLDFDATGWEGLDGPYVSHLELFGRGSETTFAGRDPKFVWRNNFPGVTHDAGSEPDGAGTGNINPLYRDNVVRVFDVETGDLLRMQTVTTQEWIYAYAYNVEDNARLGRGPQRRFRVEVTVRDTLGRESKPAKLVVENPVPALVIPTVRPGLEQIFVDFPLSTDLDAQGALVWISQDQLFDPLTTPPAYDGINNFVSLKATAFSTYYVRMAIYDAFGREGLNICPPIEVVVDGFLIDTTPPEIPTGLTLTGSTERNEAGDLQTRLVATWDISPSENFGRFDIEIRKEGQNFISFPTSTNRYEWTGLIMGQRYEVRLKAQSRNNYASGYSETALITMPLNELPPGPATNLQGQASLRSVFLTWDNPNDPDLAGIEIWFSTTNTLASATKIGESLTEAFTHAGLTTGTEVYYWVRAKNSSGLFSTFNNAIGLPITPGQVREGDIAANAIIAEHIRARTIVGDHIAVDTSLPATIRVGSTGVTIGTIENRSSDPAARINQNTTQIDPGKITIFGDTTLSSWRSGTDLTKIEGGSIAANSISANALVIGLRGLDIAGLQFSFNKTTNVISWTAGTIYWRADDGAAVTNAIAAGSATYTTGTMHIAWQKGASALTTTTVLADVSGADWVRFGTYRGGIDMIINYGRTTIDGDQINTGTIRAQQLFAGELITNQVQIKGGIIQNTHLGGGITFDKMAGGTLSASDLIRIGGDRFTLNAVGQLMQITDGNNVTRVRMGRLGAGITDYGLQLFDPSGNLVFGSGGFTAGAIPASALGTIPNTKVSGLGSLSTQNTVNTTQITGLGALATRNSLWSNEIIGLGQLATLDQLVLGSPQLQGFGSFAAISGINSANISTYISAAAISDAYIANLHGDKILANTIGAAKIIAGSIQAWHLTAGVVITDAAQIGAAVIGEGHIRDLSVDTLKIKNSAITTSAGAEGGGSSVGVSIYCRANSRVVVFASARPVTTGMSQQPGVIQPPPGATSMNLYLNGNLITSVMPGTIVIGSVLAGSGGDGGSGLYMANTTRLEAANYQRQLIAAYTGFHNFTLTNPDPTAGTASITVLEFAR